MTRSQRKKVGRGGSMVALLCALSAGCGSKHESGQKPDTATTWLRVCNKHGDCGDAHSCINHVCTLACPPNAANECSALSPYASCHEGADGSPSRCDLSCSSDRACADLGLGYACREGVCRPRGKSAPVMPGDTPSAGEVTLLPAEGPLLLSDRDRFARSPVVEARGDGWRVVWATDPYGWEEPYPAIRAQATKPVEPRIEVADIAADGTVSTRGMVHETSEPGGPILVQGGPGEVAYLQMSAPIGGECQLKIISTSGPELRGSFDFECADRGAIAPVAGSEDWLVSWYGTIATSSNLMLGRYRPVAGDWLAGPWDLETMAARNEHSLAALTEDAWFAFVQGGSARYLRVPGVAASESAEPDLPAQPSVAGSTPVNYQIFSETTGGALLFYAGNGSLRSVFITDTTATETVVAPSRAQSGASGWKTLGAVRVPERERTFVCYQGAFGGSDKVAVVPVDDRGRPLGEPIAVSDEGVYMANCSLARAGAALLATWNDLRVPRKNSSTYSVVGARIVSLP